ncbi:MAG: glycosyltransferase [Crocinitomicaceae bacterium]
MQLPEIHHKRILFSALNWGLGHVMRSIPIIRALQENGNEIIIACDEEQKPFFMAEFPSVEIEFLAGYQFNFSGKGNFGMDLFRSFPKLHKNIKNERKIADFLVKKHKIDLILSDQRFGFQNSNTKNVIISHQLKLLVPWYQRMINVYYQHYLKQFDEIWIPDAVEKEQRITGKLTQSHFKNVRFIGFLSRFSPIKTENTYAFGAIISGPHPYNKQLLTLVLEKFKTINAPCFIISSLVENEQIDQITMVKYESTSQMEHWLKQTNCIISRSGYSTIMDLKIMGLKAILIPTPGQYEQIYLGKQLKDDKQFKIMSETAFRACNLQND